MGKKKRQKARWQVGVYLVAAALAFWAAMWAFPEADYPPPDRQSLKSLSLQVDRKSVAASVSVWSLDVSAAKGKKFKLLPQAEGASCLLMVSLGFDVKRGDSVKWALRFEYLDKDAELARLPELSSLSPHYRIAKFTKIEGRYLSEDIDVLTGEARTEDANGYVLQGEVTGPVHASQPLDATMSEDLRPSNYAVVAFAWRGPSPAIIGDPYAVVNGPEVNTSGEAKDSEIPFRTYPAETFHAIWQEGIGGHVYSLQAGSADESSGQYWTWRNQRNEPLTGIFATGVDPKQAQSNSDNSFFAGILLTIFVAAAVAAAQAARWAVPVAAKRNWDRLRRVNWRAGLAPLRDRLPRRAPEPGSGQPPDCREPLAAPGKESADPGFKHPSAQ
ncbi:hypothetical protein [Streptomyces canus]|uniref:hypothetical protein n=1 Tax=Streptomyces canus TaxID=58343 RepID=UPI002E2C8267|nr:hypothetical protein [Streptomyces canus]